MNRDDLEAAAILLRKYAAAVETKLYWSMSTREARQEIAETKRLAELLESMAKNCN